MRRDLGLAQAANTKQKYKRYREQFKSFMTDKLQARYKYLNWYTVSCPWQSKTAGWQLKKGYFGGRVNLMPVLLLWLPTVWLWHAFETCFPLSTTGCMFWSSLGLLLLTWSTWRSFNFDTLEIKANLNNILTWISQLEVWLVCQYVCDAQRHARMHSK